MRIKRMFKKSPARTVATLATLALAVAVAIGTGADWSSSASNLATATAGGALSLDQSNTGAVLNVAGLSPGDTARGHLLLTDQTQAAYLSFNQTAPVDTDSTDQPVTDPAKKLSTILQYRIFRSSLADDSTAVFFPGGNPGSAFGDGYGDPSLFPRQINATKPGHAPGDPGTSPNYPNGTLNEAGAISSMKLWGNGGASSSQWQPGEAHQYTVSVYWPPVGSTGGGPSDPTNGAAALRAGNRSSWTIHWDATTTVPSGG